MAINEPVASPRPYGRSPRPESAVQPQCRPMHQQSQPTHQPVHHQQQHPHQQQMNMMMPMNGYNATMQMANNYAHQSVASPAYSNAGVSPTPSARMNQSMQSPAAAATAPIFGSSACHPAQQQGQQQLYNCPMNSPMQQQPNMMPVQQHVMNMAQCNMAQATYPQQQQGYSQAGNNVMQPVPMANMSNMQMAYNTFNGNMQQACNNQSAVMNNGNYVALNQCGGHVTANNGFVNAPCPPCNHQGAPAAVCNNQMQTPNNWQQCQGYVNNMPNQNATSMPFQPNVAWNNQVPAAMSLQPNGHMYPNAAMHQINANAMNYNYQRPPAYNSQVPTAIQCQDVSQSQDASRAREAAQAQAQGPSAAAPAAAPLTQVQGQTAAPGNMRPETYQRTLEYVQQCRSWTGDNIKAAKENKPPQAAETAASNATAKTNDNAVRALLSPGQDAVSSSTDRQDTSSAAAAPMASNASNMVVHDMNTSLNSLMQETRFLQMIQ